MGWRYFVAYKIDWNKLQIRKSSQKGTGTKIAEKLNNFENFGRKKIKLHPDNWPDALDHLAIAAVAKKYTKLGKKSENLMLSQGLSDIKIPL